ncbi:MAG: amidohydrolase family protein [Bryobacteraceae bacterium]
MKLFALAAIAIYTLPALGQTSSGSILLQDVRLIDGTGAAPKDHASILIENGRISQVFTGTNVALRDPNAQVLKLSGKTVIPGLINAHGHLGLTQGTSVSAAEYTPENITRQLAQYERYGVTTVMSLGMNKDLLYQLRSEQEKGDLGGPTILTADRGIGTPGGVPAVQVGPDQIYRPATPEEARADVREMAQRAPNLIKVWVDDNLHKLPDPKPAVYAAAIDEAHKQHLRVAAHVFYLADAKRLLQDGVDILAHSIRDQEIDPETVSLIKSKKVYYIPTLQLEESFFVYGGHSAWMDTPFFKNAMDPELAEILGSASYKQGVQRDKTTPIHKAALQTAMMNIARLRDAGAGDLIAFGTDSGANPFRIHGFAEHRELQLMVQSGMTPLEAIHAATAVNAQMLHMSEKTGSIEVTKQADLIVLDGDPSLDIANTEKINMVFYKGQQVKTQ